MSKRSVLLDMVNRPTLLNPGERFILWNTKRDIVIAKSIDSVVAGVEKGKSRSSPIGRRQMVADVMGLFKIGHQQKLNGFQSAKAAVIAFGKLSAVRSAEFVIENISMRPNKELYSAMIVAYYNGGYLEKVKEEVDKMLADGYSPDTRIYTILIKICAKNNNIERCLQLFKQMKTANVVPDRFHVLDAALCFSTPMERSDFFNKMEIEYGIKIFPRLKLNFFLDATGCVSEKQSLYEEGRSNPSCGVDNSTYSKMITAHRKANQFDEAFSIFETDMKIDECKPDVITCGAYMSACLEALLNLPPGTDDRILLYKAETCFSRAFKAGLVKEFSLINILMSLYKKNNCVVRGKLLKKFVVEQNFGRIPFGIRENYQLLTKEEWPEAKDHIQHVRRFYKPAHEEPKRLKDDILNMVRQSP